ncbi:MAG: hypothetical protein RBS55_13565, partial [Bacteroidales bacterium]|nr:hypothetical protein [Bacteroidales bacterium]
LGLALFTIYWSINSELFASARLASIFSKNFCLSLFYFFQSEKGCKDITFFDTRKKNLKKILFFLKQPGENSRSPLFYRLFKLSLKERIVNEGAKVETFFIQQ